MQTNVKEGTGSFEPDDPVWLRNYSGNPKWIAGTVVMKTGPVSYKVMSGDHIYKCHVNQIKKRSVNIDEISSQSDDEFFSIPSPPSNNDEPVAEQRRYPQRQNRQPPLRYRT